MSALSISDYDHSSSWLFAARIAGDSEGEEGGGRDEAAYARRLHAFLAPRMLRRLKHNVASLSKELPPKVCGF